jgi:hypothetical protein
MNPILTLKDGFDILFRNVFKNLLLAA